MRKFTIVFALAALVLAVLLCPGCKRRGTGPGTGSEPGVLEPVSLENGMTGLVLGEAPPIHDFKENPEVFQDIHFDFDRSEVRPADRPILESIAAYLKDNPSLYLLIEGHCDERGTNEYNLALGEKRALSTREFLAELGVDPLRMVPITLGEEDPIDPEHTEAAWVNNRRAHFKEAVKDVEETE